MVREQGGRKEENSLRVLWRHPPIREVSGSACDRGALNQHISRRAGIDHKHA
jgi:hypothetical protein